MNDVPRLRWPLLLAAACVVASHLVVAGSQATVAVSGTRVSLVPPDGFEPADLFPGFQQVASSASIVVNEIPGAVAEVRAGMTDEGLASRGMTLRSADPVMIADTEGLLISVAQEIGGIAFHKWLGLFGSDTATVLVVATFPETLAAALGEPLRQAVLSARWDPAAEVGLTDGLTFRVQETAGLRVAHRMANLIVLTRDGRTDPLAPGEPLLIVGASVSPVAIDDIQAFAEGRIRQTATVRDIRSLEGQSLPVAGVPGYEIVATATDTRSGAVTRVYQLVLLRDTVYYLVQGLVDAAVADDYVPEFRTVALSLSFVD